MAALQNIYFKRTAATAKPCYMCYRPTTTVLATLNVTDFIYTCERHLIDRGFATRLDEPKQETPTVPQAAIEAVKQEWEAKLKKKEEQKKDKEKEEGKDKDNMKEKADSSKEKEKDKGKELEKEKPTSEGSGSTAGSGEGAATPTHTRFALHRDVFAMRVDEQRRARERKAAKELAPRLPGAPMGGL